MQQKLIKNALKTNLAALKTEVDKIDTDTVKKTEFTPLKNKVDGIDTNNFVSRTKFEKDIKNLDDKTLMLVY